MRSYEEIASSVLHRRDEYLKEQKRRRAIIFRTASAVSTAAVAACIGLIILNNRTVSDIRPDPHSNNYSATEASPTATTVPDTEKTTP
ncbi:MAG TPA: hypothetical protein PLS20_07580, partial [Ruminococcus flavefaciens]|nr:hypothetical protein [Ruminococcus flavefaciens]